MVCSSATDATNLLLYILLCVVLIIEVLRPDQLDTPHVYSVA